MVETFGANFEAADVLRMFPTFVWKAQVAPGVRQEIDDHVLAKLDEMRRDAGEPAPGRGWQSARDLHHLDEFRGLVACIHDAAESVLEFLKTGDGAFELAGLWANMNPKGAAHPIHSHPNNFLSGVYYLRTHEGADTVNFHDPRPQTGIIRPPVTELTAENSDQVVVKVSDGTLLLFPSWLPHSVDASASDEIRISISFNVMLSDFAETVSQPLW
jgi:uncharacterized protein (TIGR02466 family)